MPYRIVSSLCKYHFLAVSLSVISLILLPEIGFGEESHEHFVKPLKKHGCKKFSRNRVP